MRSISPRTERSGRPQKASTTFHSDFWCRRVRRLGFHTPDLRTDGDRLAAVPHFAALSRLLDLGAVKAAYPRVTAALARTLNGADDDRDLRLEPHGRLSCT